MSALTPASPIPPTPNQCYGTPHYGVNTVPLNLKDPSVQLDETSLKVTIKSVVNEAIDEHPTIQRMGSEIGELKIDVAVVKSDVAELKIHTRSNTQAINQLFIEQQRQGVMLEDMRSDMKKLIEIVMPSKISEEQYDRMERRVENHDHRIGVLEVTVRDHVGEHERS